MNIEKVLFVALAALVLHEPAAAESGGHELVQLATATVQEQETRQEQETQQETAVLREKNREEVLGEKEALREQMREAERRLAEAARRIAELSARNLPHLQERARTLFTLDRRPRLGVTIGGSDEDGPVEGVVVDGVTPGSAAAAAGLRAGDVLTRIEDEALSAPSASAASARLLEFMGRVEAGDRLEVEYLRDGEAGTVDVEPKPAGPRHFVFRGPDGGDMQFHEDGHDFEIDIGPEIGREIGPEVAKDYRFDFRFPWVGNVWGDLEMVELSGDLGRYFGTDSGLLVISAPESEELELEDGDVIKSIDGREPTSVGHAMRILGSYEAGEQIRLRILRDKRERTIELTMPDKRSGRIAPSAPLAPAPPRPGVTPKVPGQS